MVIHRLPNGQWLISGRTVGDGLALRETLESSLLLRSSSPGCSASSAGSSRPNMSGAASAASPRRRQHQRPRSQPQRVSLSGSRRRLRPPRPADQRDARPDQPADGGIAPLDRLARARPAHPGQPAALRRSGRGRVRATRRSRRSCSPSVIRQSDIADADPELGARDQPLRSADRPQPVHLVRRGELADKLAEMYEPLAEEAGATLRYDRAG